MPAPDLISIYRASLNVWPIVVASEQSPLAHGRWCVPHPPPLHSFPSRAADAIGAVPAAAADVAQVVICPRK